MHILIDDIYHKGRDPLYAKISAHPNAEVRIFNPHAQRGWLRNLEMAFKMNTLNHRMHNKIFLVDNSVAVLGGRNIGDDYFGTDPKLNFHDLDAVVAGPIAAKAGQAFDTYWNSPRSIRIEALYGEGTKPAELAELKEHLESTHDAHIDALSYELPTESKPSMEALTELRSDLIWADAELVVDDLERFEKSRESDIFEMLRQLTAEIEDEILIQTAYLIPAEETIKGFKQLVDRGVRVRIMTNSLMSNNHVSVHGHYKKYRKALLEAGVELYELRVDDALLKYLRDQSMEIAESNAGLHTKSFVIDGKISYDRDPDSTWTKRLLANLISWIPVGNQL